MPLYNLKIVEMFDDGIYIGRAGHGLSGYFGNPLITPVKSCPVCTMGHYKNGDTLKCYEIWARRRLLEDIVFNAKVKALHNKALFCFCTPNPCHGNILIQLAKELNT